MIPPTSALEIDFTTVIVSLMGGGIVSAVAIAVKLKPEHEILILEKEEKQVVINSTLLDDYEQTQQMLRREIAELREQSAAEKALRRKAEDEQYILAERVKYLESQLPPASAG